MNTKFKFGDMVRAWMGKLNAIGVITKVITDTEGNTQYRVAFEQDLDLLFSENNIELIPHPDTVRLDYIQNRLPEIRLVECNEAGAVAFCLTRKSGFVCTNTLSPSIRETIDNAMQQEQTP